MGQDINILVKPSEYFSGVISAALEKRAIKSPPLVHGYLVQLLELNMHTDNMGIQGTFAEMLLRAQNAEKQLRHEMLRKLGDTSLYIAGFFGDSLKRKIIDIDYYAEIGGMAYGSLANEIGRGDKSEVFGEFRERFLDYVDVLTYVSQSTAVQSNQDLLRIYERYIVTGSELAKDQLMEKGLLNASVGPKKSSQ